MCWLWRGAVGVAAAAFALSIAGYFGSLNPYLEIASRFKLQYSIAGGLTFIVFWWWHRSR